MACSICDENGHNARNCPQSRENSVRDRTLIFRVDKLTINEQNKLAERIVKEKHKIAHDARATIVSGDSKDLPYQPIKQLNPEE